MIVTILSLVFGLLFYVDSFQSYPIINITSEFTAIGIVGSEFDRTCFIGNLGYKNDPTTWSKKKIKEKENKKNEQERDEMRFEMLWDLHGEDRDIVDPQNFLGNIEVPWDTQYDYTPIDFRSPSESS